MTRKGLYNRDSRTAVYRFFDAEDVLLYVGMTGNMIERLEGHDYEKAWRTSIDHVTVTWHPTRADAHGAEREAIRSENPLHNVIRFDKRSQTEAERMANRTRSLHLLSPCEQGWLGDCCPRCIEIGFPEDPWSDDPIHCPENFEIDWKLGQVTATYECRECGYAWRTSWSPGFLLTRAGGEILPLCRRTDLHWTAPLRPLADLLLV